MLSQREQIRLDRAVKRSSTLLRDAHLALVIWSVIMLGIGAVLGMAIGSGLRSPPPYQWPEICMGGAEPAVVCHQVREGGIIVDSVCNIAAPCPPVRPR